MRELVSIHLARTHDVDLESDDEAEPMAQGGSDGGGGGDGGDGGGGGEGGQRGLERSGPGGRERHGRIA